jgi:hypothetical protein
VKITTEVGEVMKKVVKNRTIELLNKKKENGSKLRGILSFMTGLF